LSVHAAPIVILAFVAAVPGCIPSDCPTTWEAAQERGFLDALPDDYVVADAVVARYVPSPDLAYRGYDLDVTARMDDEDQRLLFLRVSEPIAGIAPRDRVLVIAREEGADGIVIVPGSCPPLQRLPDD
jgi:hypothetical protein